VGEQKIPKTQSKQNQGTNKTMNKCMKVADTSFYREKADKEAKILERMNLLLEQSSQISLNVQVEEFVTVKTKSDQTHIIFIPQKSFAMLALRKIANGKAVGGTFQFFTDSVKARNSAQFTYSANYDKYLDRWYMIVKHDMSFDIVEEAATIANRAKKIL